MQSAPIYRQVREGDNVALASMIRQVFEEHEAPQRGTVYSDPTTDDLYSLFRAEHSQLWVAEVDGIPVGCGGVYPTKGLESGCAELVKYYLAEKSRGLGIGRQLMEKCIQSAREMGYEKLYLESMPHFSKAVRIYEKLGFRKLDQALGNSGHTTCSIWMLLELDIKAITMPGVHASFLKFFKGRSEPEGLKILDVGAGEGALTQSLHKMGHHMQACDLFPDHFRFPGVLCDKVDITKSFPYPDQAFHRVIAVEVTEHILDHETFFSEVNRILKPGGLLYVTTPNVLSMRSRIRFLFRGFLYAFNPLEMGNYNGRQHLASLNLDQYNYLAVKHGFGLADFDIDRKQSTSQWLRILYLPLMFITQKIKGYSKLHNQKKLLLGRLLFMVFPKKS